MPENAPFSPIEILLVDDQSAILAGVSALIESESPHMRVMGRATSGRDAISLAQIMQPDVIILDVDLGGENGLDLIPELCRSCSAAIVVFSCHAEASIRQRASRLGASNFVSKAEPGDALLAAIVKATA